jgi:hypothetical protein
MSAPPASRDIDDQTRAGVAAIFRSHASTEFLTMHEFTEALTSLGAKREYCTQYFKAFDLAGDGAIGASDFLMGIVAMVLIMRARLSGRALPPPPSQTHSRASLTGCRHLRRTTKPSTADIGGSSAPSTSSGPTT